MHVVIPAFEESRRLPPFLAELADAIVAGDIARDVAVEVIDDGSRPDERDAMAHAVDNVRRSHDFVRPIVSLPRNVGKGGAVYAGWDRAGETAIWGAFIDADGAVIADEAVRVLKLALDGWVGAPEPDRRAVFAARYPMHPGVERTLLRGALGWTFSMLVRGMFGFPVRDTQCGCKAAPLQAYRTFRGDLVEMRFCFDVELTRRLIGAGVEIRGEPIRWHESPGSKLRLRSAASMLVSLIELRAKLGRAALTSPSRRPPR